MAVLGAAVIQILEHRRASLVGEIELESSEIERFEERLEQSRATMDVLRRYVAEIDAALASRDE